MRPKNQDPVVLQVEKWLETGVTPARGDVEGGERKLLSHWSQWGRLFLRDGLVFRRWKHEVTGQEIYHQICLPKSIVSQIDEFSHPFFPPAFQWTYRSSWTVIPVTVG